MNASTQSTSSSQAITPLRQRILEASVFGDIL